MHAQQARTVLRGQAEQPAALPAQQPPAQQPPQPELEQERLERIIELFD